MEPMDTLWLSDPSLCLQVRKENERDFSERVTTFSVIRDNVSLIGIIRDTGV